MIIARYDIANLEHKRAPIARHKHGSQCIRDQQENIWWATASGYGRRIPTELMVKLPGSPRWRRVYCCCYSNAGTAYVTAGKDGKDWIVITGNA